MSWQNEWNLLSGRILTLASSSAPLFTISATSHDASHLVIRDMLLPATHDAFGAAQGFVQKWDGKLPDKLREKLRDLMARAANDELWSSPHGDLPVALRSIFLRAITILGVVRGEIEYIFGDPTQQAISITERAFKQLQWLIVADPNVAANWQRAFSEHETKCEHLGGAHLLHHGIWACKAHQQKGRTDLVLGEAIGDDLRGVARALILTEWKRVQDVSQLNQSLGDAYKQARIYAGEMLEGFELHNIRYVVLVTERRLPKSKLPTDLPEGSYIFRHINIAVKPENPSD